jgi:hypothetical protein
MASFRPLGGGGVLLVLEEAEAHILHQVASEVNANFDVNSQVAHAQSVMAQTSQMLEQQTLAARLAVEGVPARVTITDVRDTGTRFDVDPVLELSLMVTPDGGLPVPVTVTQPVSVAFLGRVTPGASIPAKADRTDPSRCGSNGTAPDTPKRSVKLELKVPSWHLQQFQHSCNWRPGPWSVVP